MYQYRLLDYHHREPLVYHRQPGSGFRGPGHPHLHISAALNAQVDAVTRRGIDLDKLHVTTGPVSLDAAIRMLITEFGVAPRRHDWRETLDRIGLDLNAALETRKALGAHETPRRIRLPAQSAAMSWPFHCMV